MRRFAAVAGLITLSSMTAGPVLAAGQRAPAASHQPHVVVDAFRQKCAHFTKTTATPPWSIARLGTPFPWLITQGRGQLVAVIDSGVQASHPQLRGAVISGPSYLRGGTSTRDCDGHGTFVAGIIAARQHRGVGFTGVAPQARLLSIRQTTHGKVGTTATLATAIRYAATHGADVINISAASKVDDPRVRSAVRFAVHHGVVIVAAAGNFRSQRSDPRTFPASYPGVVAVAATDTSDAPDDRSERGPYVDLAAPGVNVTSTGPPSGLDTGSGTSYAAPVVSGVVALVRAAHPNLSAAQVVRRLEVTADHPADGARDDAVGYGIVNPYAAVTAVLPDESGQHPRSTRPAGLPAAVTSPRDNTLRNAFGIAIGAAGALVVVVPLLVVVVRRGRARGWQAARP